MMRTTLLAVAAATLAGAAKGAADWSHGCSERVLERAQPVESFASDPRR